MGTSYINSKSKPKTTTITSTSTSTATVTATGTATPGFSVLPTLQSKFFNTTTSYCDNAATPLPPPPLPPPTGIPTGDSSKSPSSGVAPPPPPPAATGTSSPPPPPSPEGDSDSSSPSTSSSSPPSSSPSHGIPNPGPYESASMDAAKRLVTLDTHDGFRCDISKQLSPYFAVVHSFWLGTSMIPDGRNKTYSFVAQVADENGLFMARTDPERGSVDGRIHMNLLGGLAMAKLQLGLSAPEKAGNGQGGQQQGGGGQNDQMLGEVDFGGPTWTGNLKYGSMGGDIMFGCNYFQGVTKRLALGGEGVYIGNNKMLVSSYSAKYTFPNLKSTPTDDDTSSYKSSPAKEEEKDGSAVILANFNAGQGLLSVNYKRVVTPDRVTLAAELQCSPVSLDSQVVLGAEVALARSKINVCVDGGGRIQSTLETKLGMAPGSPSLSFAAEVDHGKDVMRFGYGLNIGG